MLENMFLNLQNFLNSPPGIALSAICGIIGFVLSLFIFFTTNSVKREIKRRKEVNKYNRERVKLQKILKGYIDSINDDSIKTRGLVSDILVYIGKIENQFSGLLHISEKWELHILKLQLHRKHEKIDFDSVSKGLATFIGQLSKEEE